MVWKPVGWLLALTLLLAGCAAPAGAPAGTEAPSLEGGGSAAAGGTGAPGTGGATAAGTGEAAAPRALPRLISRIVYRPTSALNDVVDGVTAVTLEEWVSEVAVGSGDVLITWQLDTHDAGPYTSLLRTRGADPAEVRAVLGVIQARFTAPLPDRWEAWLQGVGGSHTTLLRLPEPRVAVTYRAADGALRPLEGADAALPDGPLWLQLSFDQPVDQGSLAAWLADVETRTGQPLIVRQESASRWVVEMDHVPVRMPLDLRRVVAAGSGLPVAHSPVILRSESSLPYLERVDLATGAGERLLTLPPEITEAWPSPDGARIALRAWQLVEGEMSESLAAVVDLAEGDVLEAPLRAGALQWAGGLLLNRAAAWEAWVPGEPAAVPLPFAPDEPVPGAAALSPDGRTAAFLGPGAGGGPSGDEPLWLPLVLLDMQTGERQVVEAFARDWSRGKGDVSRWVAWSPDGRRIAALDPLARAGRSALVVYDLDSGERHVASEPVPVLAWGARLSWSPDGAGVLVCAEGYSPWVIPLDGSPAVPLPGALLGRAYWDGTGGRILGARGAWEGVLVYSLADGTWTELGDGLPAGWDGDAVYVIRWPGAPSRYRPSLP